MKRGFALLFLLLTMLCCTCAGWSQDVFSIREIVAPQLAESFRIEARGTREVAGDFAPAQVFELVNTTGYAVELGRLTTSCGCIRLTSAKSEYGAEEKIELVLRNVRFSSGHTYAFFVHVVAPVRTVVEHEVFVKSTVESGDSRPISKEK